MCWAIEDRSAHQAFFMLRFHDLPALFPIIEAELSEEVRRAMFA
jgi:hypothetical protein